MRLDSVLDFGYHYIALWSKCCFCLVLSIIIPTSFYVIFVYSVKSLFENLSYVIFEKMCKSRYMLYISLWPKNIKM